MTNDLPSLKVAVGELMETMGASLVRLAEGGPDAEVYEELDNAVEGVMLLAIELMREN